MPGITLEELNKRLDERRREENRRGQVTIPARKFPEPKTYQVSGTTTGRASGFGPSNIVEVERRPFTRESNQAPRALKVLSACLPKGVVSRKNDFCLCKIGELVVVPFSLPIGSYADDETGDARCFIGLDSGNKTTTAMVIGVSISESMYEGLVRKALERSMPEMEINYRKRTRSIVERTLAIAAILKEYQIVEYRDGRMAIRDRI